MRSSNKSRNRNKNGNRRGQSGGNIINRVFESAGPEGKVRGTPQQIIDKYVSLAHDSQLSGDRVAAENFQQHAEHYSRILAVAQRELAEKQGDMSTPPPLASNKILGSQSTLSEDHKASGGSENDRIQVNGDIRKNNNKMVSNDCSSTDEEPNKHITRQSPKPMTKQDSNSEVDPFKAVAKLRE